jgi:signal transduction histidine kinase
MKQESSLLPTLTALYMVTLVSLAAWWLYLIYKMNDQWGDLLSTGSGPNITKLIFWEGSTFVVAVVLLSFSLLMLYSKDRKRNEATKKFFAGLTHELKTPLASIHLQAEVLNENLEDSGNEDASKLLNRLLEDTKKLESQFDKILHVCRIESGASLHPKDIDLIPFIKNVHRQYTPELDLKLDFEGADPIIVQGDEVALEVVFKNLLENSKFHADQSEVKIKFSKGQDQLQAVYSDNGEFEGDASKLGQLFSKGKSSKGSGIGLYLTKLMLHKMGGSLKIEQIDTLEFTLSIPLARGNNA